MDKDEIKKSIKKDRINQLEESRDVKALRKLLKHKEEWIKNDAIAALGRIGDTSVIKHFCEQLNNKYPQTQLEASDILATIGKEALKPVLKLISNKKEETRYYVIRTLGKIKDKSVIQPIIRALKDESKIVQLSAVEALGNIGKPAIKPLIKILTEKDWKLRERAAKALGLVKDIDVIDPLTKASEDEVKSVRDQAKNSLKQVTAFIKEREEQEIKQTQVINKEKGKEESKIQCASCLKKFTWDEAYRCQDTPGSAPYNPPTVGVWRPRAFCPNCGILIAEWHVTREKDFDEWRWIGENSSLNFNCPLPPSPLTLWGKPIPTELLPHYDEKKINIKKMIKYGAEKEVKSEILRKSAENWKQSYNLAFAQFKQGNIEEALDLIQDAINADLPNLELSITLGAIGEYYLLKKRDVSTAIKYLTTSVETHFSGFWKAHSYIGFVYEAIGKNLEAKQKFRDAQKAAPSKYIDPDWERNIRNIIRFWAASSSHSLIESRLKRRYKSLREVRGLLEESEDDKEDIISEIDSKMKMFDEWEKK